MSTLAKYRQNLPQLEERLFLTDSGLETTLIFEHGLELPHFAAFDLLKHDAGRKVLERYFVQHLNIALQREQGFILESPTWRASADWGTKLGYNNTELAAANRLAIEQLVELRNTYESSHSPVVISGCIGPRGDGYDPGEIMTNSEAHAYHAAQISVFAESGADMVTAITMTNTPEAIGVALAAREAEMPCAISLTVETDGRLPTEQPLAEAIAEIELVTERAPAYYMINCAHPTHFSAVLTDDAWMQRVRGIRANASRCSHAELDEAAELDSGDPKELGQQYAELRQRFPYISVLGGCCGTDHRHIHEISAACAHGDLAIK